MSEAEKAGQQQALQGEKSGLLEEPYYEDHVKPWRQRHPDYQRQWRQKRKAQKKVTPGEIQAERLSKAIELTEKTHLYLREIQAEILVKPSLVASFLFQSP